MKRLNKLLIINIILLVVGLFLSQVPLIGLILISCASGLGLYIILECRGILKEKKRIGSIPKEEFRREKITEKFTGTRLTLERAGIVENEYVDKAYDQIDIFSKKVSALQTIVGLNGDGFSTTLTNNSLDVADTLVENYRRICKRVIAYQTTHNKSVLKEIESILQTNKDLLLLYNRLIEEVSRMGDEFNEQDEGLQTLISNLQALRNNNESEDDENDDPFNVEASSSDVLQI